MQLNHTLGYKLETDTKKKSHMYHVQIINLILMCQPTVSLSRGFSPDTRSWPVLYTHVCRMLLGGQNEDICSYQVIPYSFQQIICAYFKLYLSIF